MVAIITFSQFLTSIKHSKTEITPELFLSLFTWFQNIIDILVNNISDKNEFVRKHCLKGLGNIYFLLKLTFDENPEEISFSLGYERSQTILNSLFVGMEDHSSSCAREALISIQRIIDHLEFSILKPNLLNLLIRLPESFERFK